MGRGAVIELDADLHDDVWIYANNRLFGRGEIVLKGENIAIEVSRVLMRDQS
jgi:flagellar motor switch protein FliN/FliY